MEDDVLVLLMFLLIEDDDGIDFDPVTTQMAETNFGLGRGVIKVKPRESYNIQDVYEKWLCSSGRIFHQLFRISNHELMELVNNLKVYQGSLIGCHMCSQERTKSICEAGGQRFQNVDYIVAGLKSNMVVSHKHKLVVEVTKSEQVCVEHVNNFIKNFRSISGQHRHDNGTLV